MLTVAAKGSFDWRVVGRRLLPDSYQIIEDIELEYKNEQSKRDKMFKKWKEMKGSGATYRGLMAVFKELDNQEAAEMVKNLVAGRSLPLPLYDVMEWLCPHPFIHMMSCPPPLPSWNDDVPITSFI